ncbi:hypothetical protein [Bacillus sp. sid0103]|uniref:hypothetical protein n=1 Tax=Bacillus sp. sid0103 TaxID=2856337 RepID=UPI00210ABF9A|nr:hypothetical protein [Bacillus sp. sid0103]
MEINWLAEVEKRKDDLLKDLEGLLRIASVKDLTTSTSEYPMGEKLGIQYSEDVLGPLTVNAGIFNYNHTAGGSIQLNIRFPLNNDYQHTIEIITKKAETCHFTIADAQQFSTHYIPADHPMIKTLQSAYQSSTGDEPTLLTSGGGTYAALMKNAVAYGALSLVR